MTIAFATIAVRGGPIITALYDEHKGYMVRVANADTIELRPALSEHDALRRMARAILRCTPKDK